MGQRRQCPECRFDLEADDSACPFCGLALKPAPPPSGGGWARRPALKTCRDCDAAVSLRAESCPQCGCPPGDGPRPKTGNGRAVVTAIFVGFALIVLLNMLTVGRLVEKAPLKSARVTPGDRAVLDCKGGDGAYVAFGVEAWSRMAHAQSHRDAAEMQRLMDAGRIALVADGTPAKVVDSNSLAHELLILGGPHKDRDGWVRKEFVRPAPR